MLETCGLSVGFHGREVLRDVAITFEPGTFTAIIGANGAGKTTLLRTLAGLLAPHAGDVRFAGRVLGAMSSRERARMIAYVDGDAPVYGEPLVRDVVAMGRLPLRGLLRWNENAADDAAVQDALDRCALATLAHRPFDALSSGERQRVWIAAALAQESRLLLLDEPTSRLDIRYAIDVLDLLASLRTSGTALVAAMHDLERAALYADRIILLGEGRVLAAGRPPDVLTAELIEQAYRTAVKVHHADGAVWIDPRRSLPPG